MGAERSLDRILVQAGVAEVLLALPAPLDPFGHMKMGWQRKHCCFYPAHTRIPVPEARVEEEL